MSVYGPLHDPPPEPKCTVDSDELGGPIEWSVATEWVRVWLFASDEWNGPCWRVVATEKQKVWEREGAPEAMAVPAERDCPHPDGPV